MLMAQNNPQCLLYDPNGQSAFFQMEGIRRVYFFKKVKFVLRKYVLVPNTSCRDLVSVPHSKFWTQNKAKHVYLITK